MPAVSKPGMSPVDEAPRGFRWRRALRGLLDGLWFIPAVYVVLALALSAGLMRWDEADPVVLTRAINAGSATSALSALGSGMLAFTGFVTSIVLLIIQFGTSDFSPRFLGWFRTDPTLKYALSAFIATFLFALVSTAQMGRGTAAFVPTRTLIAGLLLTLLSIAMFLLPIDRTSYSLRVANVPQSLDGDARAVFDTVYPSSASQAAAAEEAARSLRGRPAAQTVFNAPVGSVLVALDRPRLVSLAESHDAVIELVYGVGDHVPGAGALLNVYGSQAIPDRHLRSALAMGDERTLRDDPAFTIRMMVDVAIKALSPAVNDPTTAVQALDRIEDVLRYAAAKHLSVGVVTDGTGVIRLVYPTPAWEDLVELALDEIRAFGAGQYQVARRLRALLDALIIDLPEHRRAALAAQSALLADAVDHSYGETQRPDALVPDRQGLGMSHRLRTSGR